jgi:hypothetical protein
MQLRQGSKFLTLADQTKTIETYIRRYQTFLTLIVRPCPINNVMLLYKRYIN